MLVFTLYKDGTAEQDGFEFRVPQGGVSANTGRIDFSGEVYKSYYDEMVAWLYGNFGVDIALDDCFGSCNNPTTPSDTRTFEYYQQYQAQILSRKTVYKTGIYNNAPFVPDTLDPDAYYYLKGSDPDTRRYIKFNFRWDTATTPSYDYYIKENGQYVRRGGDSGYSLNFAYPNITAGGSIKDFETFKGNNWTVARGACSEYQVSIGTVTIDSEAGQPKVPFIGYGYASSSLYGWLWDLYQAGDPDDPDEEEEEPEDPYDPVGPSGEEGGGGQGYPPSDPVPEPPLPSWSMANSGFVKVFIPDNTTLHQLASKLWDPNFFLTIEKFFNDPRDAIISLGAVPINVTPAGSEEIKVGFIGTGITSAYVDDPYVNFDCGSVNITEVIGSYMDYEPNTKIMLLLPYIGSVELDTDAVMKKTLNIKYHIDIISGDCTAYVIASGNVVATYQGNMRFSIPVTSADYREMWNTFLSVTTGALTGAVGAASAGGIEGATDAIKGVLQGSRIGSLTQGMAVKPTISISGETPSTAGLLGMQTPVLLIMRPRLAIPDNQKTLEGYPAILGGVLSSFSGFTLVDSIHLKSDTATAAELKEIETILKTGVII